MTAVAELRALLTQATERPWDTDGLYQGLRHLDRNCGDWYFEPENEGKHVPAREDTALIVWLVNHADRIADTLDTLAQIKNLAYSVVGDAESDLRAAKDLAATALDRLEGTSDRSES